MNILLIDDKSDISEKWAIKLSKKLGSNYNVILISDRLKEKSVNNFQIVNINNIELKYSIEELQNKYDFSIYKLLVTDRAITNYTDFSKIQMYSGYNEKFLNIELQKWVNAYDYLISKHIDIVLSGSADNFKFNMAWKIAEFYDKKFYIPYVLYWWNNGMFFADRYNQTVSLIDKNYYKYYNSILSGNDKKYLTELFKEKKLKLNFTDNDVYPLIKRVKIVLNRKGTYEGLSFKNLFFRKIFYLYAKCIRFFYLEKYFYNQIYENEKFVLYPLHVMPEASMLGTDPESADQFCLLKNISMNLPYGVKLYIKEHPAQKYGYNLNHNFYNKLLSLPNVRLIKKEANVYKMIENKNCLAVLVQNGTLGLETVYKFHKPVFVFGNADYKIADCFIKPKDWDDFFSWIQKIQQGKWKFNEQAMWAILKAFDESVVKVEDIDVNKYASWEEWAMETKIIVKFLKDINK